MPARVRRRRDRLEVQPAHLEALALFTLGLQRVRTPPYVLLFL